MSIRFLAALFFTAPAVAFEVPAINDVKVARPEQRAGTVDCKEIKVTESGAIATKGVWLESRLYSRDYDRYGNDSEGRYNRADPQQSGESHRERVQLEFTGERALLPWEIETFQAWLNGQAASL